MIFVFFGYSACAESYDDSVLEIVSKILPRLVLMSSQKNTIDNRIGICVAHEPSDTEEADTLIRKIRTNYPTGIKGYPLVLSSYEYKNVAACQKNQIAFLFDSNGETIKKAVRILHKNGVLSMSYDPIYLENGVESSLFIGRKVTPYIHFDVLQQNGIEIDNALLQISKIYSQRDGK